MSHLSCSYVLVIQQLPEVLQDPICVNYLVLRGLDTLQDDMAIPVEKRVPLLIDYYNHIADKCVLHTSAEAALVENISRKLCIFVYMYISFWEFKLSSARAFLGLANSLACVKRD